MFLRDKDELRALGHVAADHIRVTLIKLARKRSRCTIRYASPGARRSGWRGESRAAFTIRSPRYLGYSPLLPGSAAMLNVTLLAFVGDRPLGMDLIGGGNLYGRLHGRLLRGYIMEVLGKSAVPGATEPDRA